MSHAQDQPPVSVGEKGVRLAVWALLYLLPLGVALLPLFDEDIWWHLRVGGWVLDHGTVPETDPFSQLGIETGKPWIAYSWLFEVVVTCFYRALGPAGIILFRALLTLAVVAALHRVLARREPRFLVAAGLIAAGVLALLPLLTERPWLFTILFSTLTLDVILDLRAGKRNRLLWLLPLLYVIWANLHIQFIYGLFLLGLACAAPVADRLLRREPDGDHAGRAGSRAWWRLVGLTAVCLAATLANPYHVRVYQVVVEYATQRAPLTHVAEMQALGFRTFWDWCALALVCAGAFALGKRARVSAFDVLLLVAAAWFAFRARRDVWFVVLAAFAVVPTREAGILMRNFMPSRRQGLALAGIVGLAAVYLWSTRITPDYMEAGTAHGYPVEAVALVKERGYPGPLFNSYTWGGYLIWQLPELPVSIDGRANLYGDARLDQAMVTWFGQPGWDDNPDLLQARVVIYEAKAPLVSLLRRDQRFELVYEDPTAVVFIRLGPDPHAHAVRGTDPSTSSGTASAPRP